VPGVPGPKRAGLHRARAGPGRAARLNISSQARECFQVTSLTPGESGLYRLALTRVGAHVRAGGGLRAGESVGRDPIGLSSHVSATCVSRFWLFGVKFF
jgi:hypothetical protein